MYIMSFSFMVALRDGFKPLLELMKLTLQQKLITVL